MSDESAQAPTASAKSAIWKVAPEVANAEFERMCTARRIELDDSDWTEAEKTTFKVGFRDQICKWISKGVISINNDGNPSFMPAGATRAIVLGKVTGATLLATDGKVQNARMFAGLADMCGVNAGTFSTLDKHDIDVLSVLWMLFMAR